MKILMTNNALDRRAGSELYIRDVAMALKKRGHEPMAYSQELGEVSGELRASSIEVVDDLGRLSSAPDVIHGHHHLETMTALQFFPGVPAISFCHGWTPWQEAPLVHPRISHYVAVDGLCLERLLTEGGVAREKIEVLYNFVDLDRFLPRPPLPERPRRALVLSNEPLVEDLIQRVRGAFSECGMDVSFVGIGVGNPTAAPEHLMAEYDLVMAKGRSALEAMSVGCAVILFGYSKLGPLVSPHNFDHLRPLNFGFKAIEFPVERDGIVAAIRGFDRGDVVTVRDRVRRDAGLEHWVDRLIALYEAHAGSVAEDRSVEGRATADYLRMLAPRIKRNEGLEALLHEVSETSKRHRKDIDALTEENARLRRIEAKLENERAARGDDPDT